MNRLTEWRGEHAAVVNHHENYIDRLAAYEDTGLTPEEIVNLQGEMITAYDPDYQPYLVEATGSAAKHIIELRCAEDDGRLVVLPCKVGDTLFDIYEAKANGTGEIKALPVAEMHIHVDKRNKAWFIIGGYYFDEADFGKTVFLTREEAEAALKGGTDNA